MRSIVLIVLLLAACTKIEQRDSLKENCLKNPGYRWDENARMCMPPNTSTEGPIRYGDPNRSIRKR
mgnify:CR=1 FL=1